MAANFKMAAIFYCVELHNLSDIIRRGLKKRGYSRKRGGGLGGIEQESSGENERGRWSRMSWTRRRTEKYYSKRKKEVDNV